MTGISFEQLNLYSQLSGELLMPTLIPRSKSSPDSVARICRISTTGSRTGPNCRCGLSYLVLMPLGGVEVAVDPHQVGNGPRSTTMRMLRERGLPALVEGGGRVDPSASWPLCCSVLLYCA